MIKKIQSYILIGDCEGGSKRQFGVVVRHHATNWDTVSSTSVLGTKPIVCPWASHFLSLLERRQGQTTS